MTPLCGSRDQDHVARRCPDCKAIWSRRDPSKPPRRRCRSCKVREITEPPTGDFKGIAVQTNTWEALERAAVEFDSQSAEKFTALEFLDWLKPDVVRRESERDAA